jgi:hypothetical protein
MRDLQGTYDNGRCEVVWFNHSGGPSPLGAKTVVIVRYRCGAGSKPIEAGTHRWQSWPSEIGETAFDIVAWRHAERE